MKLILLPTLYYDVTIEDATGKTFCKFYTCTSPLRSRELALTYFLETVYHDGFKPEEQLVSVYLRHQDGERVEIVSTFTFGQPENCWFGLERELQLYRKEKLNPSVVVYNSDQPEFITILPAGARMPLHKTGDIVVALEQEHHLFFKRKKVRRLSA